MHNFVGRTSRVSVFLDGGNRQNKWMDRLADCIFVMGPCNIFILLKSMETSIFASFEIMYASALESIMKMILVSRIKSYNVSNQIIKLKSNHNSS